MEQKLLEVISQLLHVHWELVFQEGGLSYKAKMLMFIKKNIISTRPVRLQLDLETNMKLIGKRFAYLANYEVMVYFFLQYFFWFILFRLSLYCELLAARSHSRWHCPRNKN